MIQAKMLGHLSKRSLQHQDIAIVFLDWQLDFIPDRPPECGPCREAEPWRQTWRLPINQMQGPQGPENRHPEPGGVRRGRRFHRETVCNW